MVATAEWFAMVWHFSTMQEIEELSAKSTHKYCLFVWIIEIVENLIL